MCFGGCGGSRVHEEVNCILALERALFNIDIDRSALFVQNRVGRLFFNIQLKRLNETILYVTREVSQVLQTLIWKAFCLIDTLCNWLAIEIRYKVQFPVFVVEFSSRLRRTYKKDLILIAATRDGLVVHLLMFTFSSLITAKITALIRPETNDKNSLQRFFIGP